MAANNKTWLGGAATQVQVDTITIAVDGTPADNTFTVVVTDEKGQDHTLAAVTGDTDAATTAATIIANFNASFDQEHRKITAAGAAAITFTADTAGVPFYLVINVAGVGAGTATRAATTANKGPNDYNCVDNWLEGAVPLADTTIHVRGAGSNILYGLHVASVSTGAAHAVSLQESILIEGLKVYDGCSTAIGSDGAYLHLDCKTICSLKGSGNIWLHVDNMTGTLLIEQSAVGAGTGTYGVNLRVDEGTDQTDIVCNLPASASVGVATQAGATAADDGDATSIKINGGEVRLGTHGIPTITSNGGATVYNESNITTISAYSGEFYSQGSSTITTANIEDATFVGNSTGTLTTLNVKGSGVADFSQDSQSKTVTNINLYGRATFKDPNGVVTATNGIDLHDANLDDITLDLAKNKTWTQSAI